MATNTLIIPLIVILTATAIYPDLAESAVSGFCSDCHTMHNSQDGAMVYSGGPGETLLVNDCIGCHSSSGTLTIVDPDNNKIPIVYNTSVPVNILAGGNFYWVQNSGDAYGHNVYGISFPDETLLTAPGSTGCADTCHSSLSLEDANNGCRGCHNSILHHGTDPAAGEPENAASGWFRFLSAPSGHTGMGGAPVIGIEDDDWEKTSDASDHNIYYRGTGSDLESPQSMGKFCAGCHAEFHSPGFATSYDDSGGYDGNPWLRHPTDYAIPQTDEYAALFTDPGNVYDPDVPVGKPMTGYTANLVVAGDTVMCLSCHRAHGSPYPDMLRWNYDSTTLGLTGTGAATGCFKCHTEKDGV